MNSIPEIENPLTNGRIVKTDCPIKEYLDSKGDEKQPILSRSDLYEIALCPRRWRNGFVEPDRRLPSIEFGSLFDCLLLQPERFSEYYMLAQKEYTNSKKQVVPWTWKSSTCRDWRDEQEAAGHLVCTQEALDEANAAVKALLTHPELGEQTNRIIKESDHQVFVIAEYHDRETGMVVPVKCLTDIVPPDQDPDFGKSLIDLKTARSADPRGWLYAVRDQGYHIQGAVNLDCHNACPGADRQDFRHLIVENFPPWEPARRCLSTEFITIGRMWYLEALKLYCRCVKSGYWPSYAPIAGALNLAGYETIGPDERIPLPESRAGMFAGVPGGAAEERPDLIP